ncbi:MAG TPA: DUF177 domain-containing protein [Phenylobacterium sp.]|nr:DUF177 domain-containing protein [Phenylobacterium sp.]
MSVHLEPDAAIRGQIAKDLGLESLPALTADISLKAWLDGAEISGRFDGVVEQICGVTLEAFRQPIGGEIEVRVVPAGSEHAPIESAAGEIELDPDAPDPPDVLEGDTIDLAAYLVEHLALAIDPFPRKPGAVFDYEPETREESPFAALKRLKDKEA